MNYAIRLKQAKALLNIKADLITDLESQLPLVMQSGSHPDSSRFLCSLGFVD